MACPAAVRKHSALHRLYLQPPVQQSVWLPCEDLRADVAFQKQVCEGSVRLKPTPGWSEDCACKETALVIHTYGGARPLACLCDQKHKELSAAERKRSVIDYFNLAPSLAVSVCNKWTKKTVHLSYAFSRINLQACYSPACFEHSLINLQACDEHAGLQPVLSTTDDAFPQQQASPPCCWLAGKHSVQQCTASAVRLYTTPEDKIATRLASCSYRMVLGTSDKPTYLMSQLQLRTMSVSLCTWVRTPS